MTAPAMYPPVVAGARTTCPVCERPAPVTVKGRVRAHNTVPGGPNCSGGGQQITNLTEV